MNAQTNKPPLPHGSPQPRDHYTPKRGKGFPPAQAAWGNGNVPGRGPYDPTLGSQVLREALGSGGGNPNKD